MYLTKRQKEVYDYISGYVDEHGYAPTLEEIGGHFGLSSPATVYKHVQQLVRKGLLRKARHQGRGIELVDGRPARSVEAPLRGDLGDGELPGTSDAAAETIELPPGFAATAPIYVLRVRGNAFRDESLVDGDLLVLEDRRDVRDGETVLAQLPGEGVALGRYFREAENVRLQPRRAGSPARLAPEADVRVRGVLVGLLRSYR